nr:ABC transporter permease subunit [Paracoccus sp. S-4012]
MRTEQRLLPVIPPLAISLASCIIVLAFLEWFPRFGYDSQLPSLSGVLGRVYEQLRSGQLTQALLISGQRWGIGFGAATIFSLLLGLLMARSRFLAGVVQPVLGFIYPMPNAILILIFAGWLGVGLLTMSGIVMLAAMVPASMLMYHAFIEVDEKQIWAARSLGCHGSRLAWSVTIPAVAPRLLTALRIALPTSLFATIGTELLIRNGGIGAFLFNAYAIGDYQTVWGAALVATFIGVGLDSLFYLFGRLLFPWDAHLKEWSTLDE